MPEHKLHNIIDKWRRQRRTLQNCLLQTLMNAHTARCDELFDQALQSFCTELIDYVSTGHFSVYTHPLRHSARKTAEHSDLLQGIYQHIGSTTDQVLQFNDRVEASPHSKAPDTLHNELLKLHKALCVRFALEEQLLELGSAQRFSTSS